MKTELIKKYFYFALENGWKPFNDMYGNKIDVEIDLVTFETEYENEDIVRSERVLLWQESVGQEMEVATFIGDKEFIESISRGMELKEIQEIEESGIICYIQKYITTQQAIAIRDNTLDTFITQILGKQ